MAKVNKAAAVKKSTGLPTKEQLLTAPQNTDTMQTSIQGLDGTDKGPALLTEGEIVFSIPAIIAVGEGDYDAGAQFLQQLQEELRIKGEEIMASQQ